jgi:hypothetical protein
MTDDQYSSMTDQKISPWTPGLQHEVTTQQNPFENYSINGRTGIELVFVEFTPQNPVTYYFIVDPAWGEAVGYPASAPAPAWGRLLLWHNETQWVHPLDKWATQFSQASALAAVGVIVVSVVLIIKKPTEKKKTPTYHPDDQI